MGYDLYIAKPDPVAEKRKSELWQLIYGPRRDTNGTGLIGRLKEMMEAGQAPLVKEEPNMWDYWWEKHEEEGGTDEWRALREQLREVMKEHNEVERQTYFRLNIWGMQVCRGAMWDRNMVTDDTPEDAFPQPESYGLDDWPDYEDEWPDDSKEAKFLAKVEEHLAKSPEEPGIPLYKLGSNDGWLVTEEDCAGALTKLRDWAKGRATNPNDDAEVEAIMVEPPIYQFDDGPGPVEWWSEWVDFLRLAATHGGFKVH